MPVTGLFSKYCPLLLESDVLSLSREFCLETNGLHDVTLGITHGVASPGEHILSLLSAGAELRRIRIVADEYGLKDTQVTELLGFLNLTGALVRRRRWRDRITAAAMRLRDVCLNIYHTPLSWRQPGGILPLAGGLGRATLPLIVASAAVSVLIMYAGQQIYTLAASGLALFLASLYCHEVMHICIIRYSGSKTALLQRGLRVGVIHSRLSPRREILSALAGPATGMFCSFFAGAILYVNGAKLAALLGMLSGLFHIGSLVPWYGDGASLRAALKEMRT